MKDVFKFLGFFLLVASCVIGFILGVVTLVHNIDSREQLEPFAEYKLNPGQSISTIYYCGHTYLLFQGHECCSLLHSPNCECSIK